MKLIVGLGNPEEKYARTRHNLGFELLDDYRRKHGLRAWVFDKKFNAEVIKFNQAIYGAPGVREQTSPPAPNAPQQLVQETVILARPQTYMNNSGLAVAALKNYFKVEPADILIIHDELDLPLGKMRIRLGGAAAGHHGVESIIDATDTDRFARFRLGIGTLQSRSSEHGGQSFNAEHFVVSEFEENEKSHARTMLKRAVEILRIYLEKGLEKAQKAV